MRVEILDAEGRTVVDRSWPREDAVNDAGQFDVMVDIPQAKLWSTYHPYLYTAKVSLVDGAETVDALKTRFGVRKIEIRGPHIYLNGTKLMVQGYGDDSIYPETIAPPTDKEFYRKRLRVAKDYGFNHARHHTHFVNEEYYEACDEMGLLVAARVSVVGTRQELQGGPGTPGEPVGSGNQAIPQSPGYHVLVGEQRELRGFGDGAKMYGIAKALDPTRPAVDSEGVYLETNRDSLDINVACFLRDDWRIPMVVPDKYEFDEPIKPIVEHEMGNYLTFLRAEEDAAGFRKTIIKAPWCDQTLARMEKMGLLGEAKLWSRCRTGSITRATKATLRPCGRIRTCRGIIGGCSRTIGGPRTG